MGVWEKVCFAWRRSAQSRLFMEGTLTGAAVYFIQNIKVDERKVPMFDWFRRNIVVNFALIFLIAVITACRSISNVTPSGATATVATPASTTVQSTQAPTESQPTLGKTGCPMTQVQSADESATLTLGPTAGIPATTAQGERLVIIGTVYADDCTPLPGATLTVWQTDAEGVYGPGHDTDDLQCCYLQGSVRTDADGHYQLITVRPGHYKGQEPPPPAHIHMEVAHAQASPLMTESVFADDQYLSDPENEGYIVVTLTNASDSEGAYLFGVADVVLQRSAAAAGGAKAASGGSRTFQIVPEQSEATYQIEEKFADFASMTSAIGVTNLLEGALTINLDAPPSVESLTMTVDLRGLKTGEINRDEKLADRWLVTNDYPFAYFTATGIENGPGQYTEGEEISFTLLGDMTIRDITRPMTFDVTAKLAGDTLTGTATGQLKMTDFGIDPPNLLGFVKVEDEVMITVNFTMKENL
jgi:protocatechuate 3,4-dioxygenase beta subunit/polyisoprenoid-binding protein YceI